MQSSHQSAAVPAHLRRYVVEQDYDEYSELDHAVWRFVMTHAHEHLQRVAHPSYLRGLSAVGIDIDRIPRIADMHQALARLGWGAVCVDGFIPPRAFQDFQANKLLPIAAEIRSSEHLAYTPAPDILHEAAGHAPMLSEPAYAAFVQTFGATAARAFGSPEDRTLHRAIHALSALKERPNVSAAQLAAATNEFEAALAGARDVSESARLSRLYWWTAEYGLVGTPDDYRLYGAGLISSLGESRSCLSAQVRKLPLSAGCVEVDYDITRAQPQLFVARDFAQPLAVLADVSAGMAQNTGGLHALKVAQRSEELATLTLDTGLSLLGVVDGFTPHHGQACLVQLTGAPALARGESLLEVRCPQDYVVPLGATRDGQPLGGISQDALARHMRGDLLTLELASGLTVQGVMRDLATSEERIALLQLERCTLRWPDGRTFRAQSLYPVPLATTLSAVWAGAPAAYFGSSEPSLVRVPRPRWLEPAQQQLITMYEQALQAFRHSAGETRLAQFARLADALERDFPRDWLLRWNLLESLRKVGGGDSLAARLERELEALELAHAHQAPIATGLASLRARATRRFTDPH